MFFKLVYLYTKTIVWTTNGHFGRGRWREDIYIYRLMSVTSPTSRVSYGGYEKIVVNVAR